MLYDVTFVKKSSYEVNAESEEEAEHKAYAMFETEMKLMAKRKIADSSFDSYEISKIVR